MQAKIGVLLINLGTPDSPSNGDVRKYLNEFLTDWRVIDIPAIPRQLLVRGLITPFRSRNSAKSYREIWDERGSPLKYISEDLTKALQESLDKQNDGKEYVVELAMRYQSPSIEQGLLKLREQLVNQYIILPLFPQYSSASTGSAHQEVMRILSGWQTIPPVNFIQSYCDNPDFIDAFVQIGSKYNAADYDHILFSFHGIPQRQLRKADTCNYCLKTADCCETMTEKNQFCYGAQCLATAQALAAKMNLPKDKYTVSYQSRLGKDPWMQPYTVQVLEELAKKGHKKVLVYCPAFVSDCLETIFEIAVEYQEDFEKFGGEKVQLVESLNTHPLWVKTLKNMIISYETS